MDRPRILIADNALVAEGFKSLIEPEYQVTGVVTDEKALLSVAAEMKPDVVLLDMDMSLQNGIDLGRELKKLVPGTKLILLAINDDPEGASKALCHWSSGYLLKKSADVELKRAVGEVLRGHSYVTPSIAQKLIDEFIRTPQQSRTQRAHHPPAAGSTAIGRRAIDERSSCDPQHRSPHGSLSQISHHGRFRTEDELRSRTIRHARTPYFGCLANNLLSVRLTRVTNRHTRGRYA